MEISDLKNIPVSITVGSFDGLHRGHAELLGRLKRTSCELNTSSLIITFDPHPRKIVDSEFDLKMLNDADERTELLKFHSPDHVHSINFTKGFAGMTYEEFYTEYLFGTLDIRSVTAGSNHFFGKGRKGGPESLSRICSERSVRFEVVEPVVYKGKNISSTRIRLCINNGEIDDANSMLGYRYSISGTVVEGNGVGAGIGFPTANIDLSSSEKVIPASGAYLVSVKTSGGIFYGMSNIGTKPTLGNFTKGLETNIFGPEMNLYGDTIRVFFIERLREERKFRDIDELRRALEKDRAQAEKIISATAGEI